MVLVSPHTNIYNSSSPEHGNNRDRVFNVIFHYDPGLEKGYFEQ